jgi:hypothetical protein
MLRYACRALLGLGVLAAAGGSACAADTPPDPLALYGGEMVFTVWRSGSEIGQHRVTFARDGDSLRVRSLFDIAVKFLGVTVYRFKYEAQEVWRDGRLAELVSTIDDNGKPSSVQAKEEEDGKLAVIGPDSRETVEGPILPSSHWNAQVIDASRVLNTLNGKIDQVKLVPLGVETVPVGAASREATHYRYTGALNPESWYDAEGHWLKLRFPGKDGTLIDYVCVRCVAAP